jgi:hypothetical protein
MNVFPSLGRSGVDTRETYLAPAVVGILSIALAAAIVVPGGRLLLVGSVGLVVMSAIVLASPEFVLGLAAIIFGTFQISDSHPIHVGSTSVYSTDLLLGLLLARAFSPQDRRPGGLKMHPIIKGLAVAVGLLFLYADWRGRQAGLPIRSLFRIPLALFYFPAFTFSFSRILRERSLELPRLYRTLGGIGLAFIVLMFAARITGTTFATNATFSQNSNGYKVVTADGTLLRRDYGFPSAFVLYPLLALQALAFAVYARSRSGWAISMVVAGSFATLLTLIRGEIFGLLVGALVLYMIAPRSSPSWVSRRAKSLVVVAAALALGGATVSVASPELASGLAQRSLPGILSQGAYAQKTASDRVQAFSVGYHEALKHPLGIGFRDEATLAAETGVDPLFVAHSTPAWFLVFTGWPGFIAAIGLALAAIVASFVARAREPWHHPAFVATACFFLVYSFSTFGLVGQPWVIGIATLFVALRFTEIVDQGL